MVYCFASVLVKSAKLRHFPTGVLTSQLVCFCCSGGNSSYVWLTTTCPLDLLNCRSLVATPPPDELFASMPYLSYSIWPKFNYTRSWIQVANYAINTDLQIFSQMIARLIEAIFVKGNVKVFLYISWRQLTLEKMRTGQHWDSFSAATICTFILRDCIFPRDLIKLRVQC